MKHNMFFLLTLIVFGCQKDNPVTTEQKPLPEVPQVIVTNANYVESDLQIRVPDTTYIKKCCALYKFNLTDSSKRYVANVLLQKAKSLNQDTSIVSECLKATGQLKDSLISVAYFAERAKYQSKDCWIFEFAWGLSTDDLGHHRCFVMDVVTKDTLLFITCR